MEEGRRDFLLKTGKFLVLSAAAAGAWEAVLAGQPDRAPEPYRMADHWWAMAIDVETRRPKLSNVVGGLSGPAIRPIAVRMVYECRRSVKLPIIGMGGIATVDDALEFIIAGASAIQIGTANFVDPFIWDKVIAGLSAYLERHRIARVADLVGRLDLPDPEHA